MLATLAGGDKTRPYVECLPVMCKIPPSVVGALHEAKASHYIC